MKHAPLVSVLTRTRSRPALLRRAALSVLGQSFGDWEHIVVNDGGDPAAVEECLAPLAELYAGRLRVVHLPAALGMQAAANAALKLASGTYVAIHDDDDSWDGEFLAATTAFLEKEGAESRTRGVITHTVKVEEDLLDDGSIAEVSRSLHMSVGEVNLFRAGFENPFVPICFLFRREACEALGGFDERYDVAGDLDFNVRFLARWEIGVIPRPLANYHVRRQSSNAAAHNSVTAQTRLHGQKLSEWMNDMLRADAAGGRAQLGLAMNAARFSIGARERIEHVVSLCGGLGVELSRLPGIEGRIAALAALADSLRAYQKEVELPKLADLKEHLDSLTKDIEEGALLGIADLKAHFTDATHTLVARIGTVAQAVDALTSDLAALREKYDGNLLELRAGIAASAEADANLSAKVDEASRASSEVLSRHAASLESRIQEVRAGLATQTTAIESAAKANGEHMADIRQSLSTTSTKDQIEALAGALSKMAQAGAEQASGLAARIDAVETLLGEISAASARRDERTVEAFGDIGGALAASLETLKAATQEKLDQLATRQQQELAEGQRRESERHAQLAESVESLKRQLAESERGFRIGPFRFFWRRN